MSFQRTGARERRKLNEHKDEPHQKFLCITASVLLVATMDVHAKRFKVAVGDAGGSAQHELGEKFAEEVKRLSGGKHRVKLFLNGQLGSEQDTVNDAALGTLDMSLLAINNITQFSPTVGIFTLPYVILSLDDAVKLTQGPIGQELVENTIRDAKVRIIGWTYTGFRVLTNSKKPVRTVADLEGLIIRVPKNEIMLDTYKSWGINATRWRGRRPSRRCSRRWWTVRTTPT